MTMESEPPFAKIAVLENAIEAQLLGSVLSEYGIPHRLRSYHDTAYDGLFQLQKGWGEVCGPEEVRRQIADALAELRSRAVDLPDVDSEG